MNYLQRVIAFVKSEKCVAELIRLGEKLQKTELLFQCLQGESITCARMVVNCTSQQKNDVKNGQLDSVRQNDMILSGAESQTRLWITDCAEWAACLRMQNEAVLALLHEDNHSQDFSGIMYACEDVGELDADYIEKVYRRYVNLPWDITETQRCIIRETTEADVDAFWEIYRQPEITRYTEGLYPTVELEKQYIREYIEKVYGFYGFGVWTIVLKDTGEVIGRAGFSYREGYEEPEIGFVIGIPWQRQGYACEVCSALLEYAVEELGFTGVGAFVMPENEASIQLCRKLGMEATGTVLIDAKEHLQLRKVL